MPKTKLPAFMFYTGDWVKDPNLSMCSPASRGIWADVICAMHDSDRSGRLTGTAEQLSRVCRSTLAEMQSAITELDATGTATVTIRNGVVTLVCRRMEREYKLRQQDKKRQDRHRGKPDVTPVSRSCHKPLSSSSSISSSPSGGNPPDPPGEFSELIPDSIRTPEFAAAWTEFLQHRREIRHSLTPTSAKRTLEKLGAHGVDVAVAAVSQAIEKGWQGVFPEKITLKGSQNGHARKPTPAQRGDYGGPTGGGRRELPDPARGGDAQVLPDAPRAAE